MLNVAVVFHGCVSVARVYWEWIVADFEMPLIGGDHSIVSMRILQVLHIEWYTYLQSKSTVESV